MKKSYYTMENLSLMTLVLGIILLSGCSQDNTTVTPSNITVSSEIQSSQDKIQAGKTPESTNPQLTDVVTNNIISPEDVLKKGITEIIKVNIDSLPIRDTLRMKSAQSSKDTSKNESNTPVLQKEQVIGNIHIYTIKPFGEAMCGEGVISSDCVNFIIDTTTSEILFTDIGTDSVGIMHGYNPQTKIAYFSTTMGEGSSYSYGSITIDNAVQVGTNDIFTRIMNQSGTCERDCESTDKAPQWKESKSTEYRHNGKKIEENPDIVSMFDFIKK